jgi:putative transposase
MQKVHETTHESKDVLHFEDMLPEIDRIAREGARRMIMETLRAEADEYVERFREARDPKTGWALVTRNGTARPRHVTVGSGAVEIAAPRVNDERRDENGEREQFRSSILPPYMRKSPKIVEVLPILYLRGLSTGSIEEPMKVLLGREAAGMSASAITRLVKAWKQEYDAWRKRRLDEREYVYIWVDGVYFNVRLEEDRVAALVVIGVRADGTKELIAIEDGYRESVESWLSLLRDLKERGMRAPVVAVGDGALAFWSAVAQVWPETRGQRCWVHVMRNVLDKLPKRLHTKAHKMLREMMYAATRADCEAARRAFVAEFGVKYDRAVASLTSDWEKLVTYYDLPAEHWKSLRTTNVIESPFASTKARVRGTKGAGSREAGLTMAFKLLRSAQDRWRKINGPELLAMVLAGAKFPDGVRVAEKTDATTEVAA